MKNKKVRALIAVGVVTFSLLCIAGYVRSDRFTEAQYNRILESIECEKMSTSGGSSAEGRRAPADLYKGNKGVSDYAVKETTKDYANIYVAPGALVWMSTVADEFNHSGIMIDDKEVSVRLVEVESGKQVEWITGKKCKPDAICPIDDLFVYLIAVKGMPVEYTAATTVMDYNGFCVKKSVVKKLGDSVLDGGTGGDSVLDGVLNGSISLSWDGEFCSEKSLDLILYLMCRDGSAARSNEGKAALQKLLNKGLVEQDADAFVSTYSEFCKGGKEGYVFVPFGRSLSYPIVCMNYQDEFKKSIVQEFSKLCQSRSDEFTEVMGFQGTPEGYEWCGIGYSGDDVLAATELFAKGKDRDAAVVTAVSSDNVGYAESSIYAATQSDKSITLVQCEDKVAFAIGVDESSVNQVVDCEECSVSLDDGVYKAIQLMEYGKNPRVVVVTDRYFKDADKVYEFAERKGVELCILDLGESATGVKGHYQKCTKDDLVYWMKQYVVMGIK